MYEDFYRFSSKPFQLIPDLKYLFHSRGHDQALAYFNYGLEQGEGFVTITGEIGAGKTTLIQALLSELSEKDVEVATMVAANLDAMGILSMIASVFGLPYEANSKVALLKVLEDHFFKYRNEGKKVLLVVDEAQTLNTDALEELRILSNLERDGSAVMQIFLVGQVELRQTILSREFEHLRQRIIASYHLEPLSEAETRDYIQYRLEQVGWKGDSPEIDDAVFDEIFRWSKGIPRKINLVSDRLFVFGFLEEKMHLTRREIDAVISDLNKELGGQSSVSSDNIDRKVINLPKAQQSDLSSLESRLEKIEHKLDKLIRAINQRRRRKKASNDK